MAKLHEALAALHAAPKGSTVTRAGGRVVRLSKGEEGRLARYVCDGADGPEIFDTSADDYAADDWAVLSPAFEKPEPKADVPKADAPKAEPSKDAKK